MITPDELCIMTEKEKLDLIHTVSEAEEWQSCFEQIYLRLMDDESALVRQEAVAALWELAAPRHIDILMRKAENDPSPEVRGKAAGVLGVFICEGTVDIDESRYQAVRGFLLDLANDPDESLHVRRMSIEALSFDADDKVHDLIEWAYEQASVEVRMSALFAMGRSQSPRWHEVILAEIDNDELRIKQEAINAVAETHLDEATPKLRVLAGHSNLEIRLAAIWALGQTRGPGALETLEMCTQADDNEVRRVAHEAIAEYNHAAEFEDEEADDYDDYEQE